MYSEEVKKLAETLKNSGLAASMVDALEKAQSMVGTNEAMKEGKTVEPVEPEEDLDVAQTTLGNIKEKEKNVNETVETEDELKEEEVFADKVETEQKPKSSQNKIDLTEIFNVNK